jgi:hypothetical protein
MNLHGIVSGAISTINPAVNCQLQMSAGYSIAPDGTQVPAYNTFFPVPCQIQALTYSDLQKMDALNIQGVRRKIYLNGTIEGVDRAAIKGGDIFTFPDGSVWLVAMALENWPDWSALAVTKQVS